MADIGTISLNLRANLAQFDADLKAAGLKTEQGMQRITAAMQAESRRSSEALRLFGEGIDVRISRPLAKVISQMQGLAPVLSAAFSIGATAAFAGLLVDKIVPALTKAKDLLLYTAPATDQAKPLEDLVKLQEKGVQLERTLAEIGKSQIEIMKLRVKWAGEELALAHAKLDTDLKDAQAGLVIMQAHLAALSEAGGFGGVGVEAFVPKGTQEAADALQKKIDQITQTLKNLDTQSKIAGGNLKVALAEEAAKALTPLERMGLEIESIGNRAKATLGKVQGLLPKDELQQMEDALKQINAELTAIENYKAGSPQKIFTDLNAYANKLLVAQQAITAEYDKQLQLLIQQGLQTASASEKFPTGIMAPPVTRIPVSPGAQSAADFERIKADIARVNDLQARGLITTAEATRQIERLRREWADLALAQNLSGMGLTAALHNVGTAIGNLQQQMQRGWESALGGMHRAFTNFGHNIVLGTRGIGDAFSQLGIDMLSAVVDSLAQMLADWVLTHTLMKAISAIFHTTDVAESLAANTIKTTTGIASNMALALSNAAVAATAAGASVAAIPLVGWSMVPGVVASTYALESAFASMAALAEGGLVTGPAGRDVIPARLTAGEYVMSAPAVRGIGIENLNSLNSGRGLRASAGAAIGGGGIHNENYSVNLHNNVSAVDGESVAEFFRRNGDKMAAEMERQVRRGRRFRS